VALFLPFPQIDKKPASVDVTRVNANQLRTDTATVKQFQHCQSRSEKMPPPPFAVEDGVHFFDGRHRKFLRQPRCGDQLRQFYQPAFLRQPAKKAPTSDTRDRSLPRPGQG
jgi:hypothetical protein